MPLLLSKRDTTSQERMDDPNCDPEKLRNTYRQFEHINTLISQWRYIYKQHIRPKLHTQTHYSFLDIGFGGGDIPIKIAQWLTKDGISFNITAIDPDPRAINYIQSQEPTSKIEFLQCQLSDLDRANQQFDFILSNHLIHHLTKKELSNVCSLTEELCSGSVVFNDLQRSDWAYLLFNIFSRPFFRNSFITEDGLTSIKRSYTPKELQEVAPSKWTVRTLFPFRILLTYHHE
ncbi:class I SAM-dependent methyltransferase [Fodinibius sp. Rm-B-1B1-1]|uniref:class I SAM-dependent methyltransferase n=1 Tax=Fodinibius alkaliphilus TaxID=3140241 RepID=UPI00315A5124